MTSWFLIGNYRIIIVQGSVKTLVQFRYRLLGRGAEVGCTYAIFSHHHKLGREHRSFIFDKTIRNDDSVIKMLQAFRIHLALG